jgi:hypothetical protein
LVGAWWLLLLSEGVVFGIVVVLGGPWVVVVEAEIAGVVEMVVVVVG